MALATSFDPCARQTSIAAATINMRYSSVARYMPCTVLIGFWERLFSLCLSPVKSMRMVWSSMANYSIAEKLHIFNEKMSF